MSNNHTILVEKYLRLVGAILETLGSIMLAVSVLIVHNKLFAHKDYRNAARRDTDITFEMRFTFASLITVAIGFLFTMVGASMEINELRRDDLDA